MADDMDVSSPGNPRDCDTKGLPRNVVETGLVSFFGDISSEMLYPLTPILLTAILGAPAAVVGAIEGVAEAIASLAKPAAGRLSDNSGRRVPYMIWGYSLATLAKPLIALARAWPVVLFARSVDRLGKGVRTAPRDAYIADSVEERDRGRAFGWHRALDTAGAVVGASVSLLLLWLTHGNLRLVVWLALIPGLISMFMVSRLHEAAPAYRPSVEPVRSRSRVVLGSRFRLYVLVWTLFTVTNSSDVFIILRAKNVGLSTSAVVLLYVLYNAVYAAASPRLGALSDKLGRRKLLIGGMLIFSAVYLGLALANTAWHLAVLYAAYGLYMAATEGVGKALAVDLVPSEGRASAVGILGMATGVAALIASVIAGLLWSEVGPWAPFAYGASGALIAATLMFAAPSLRRV